VGSSVYKSDGHAVVSFAFCALQISAVSESALQCLTVRVAMCVAVCCSCCSVLQRVAA